MRRYRIVRILIFVVTPESITIAYCLAMFGGICYGCAGLGLHYHSQWPRGDAPAPRESATPLVLWQPDAIRSEMLDVILKDPESTLPHMAIAGPGCVPLVIEMILSQQQR